MLQRCHGNAQGVAEGAEPVFTHGPPGQKVHLQRVEQNLGEAADTEKLTQPLIGLNPGGGATTPT